MHMENQFSCGSCGQVSKTAKKLQGLKVRSFGIILHKMSCVSVFWFDVLEIPMFGVRVFVAQNICLLYLSLRAFLCSAKYFLGEFGIFFLGGGTFPPDVPRINPGREIVRTLSVRVPRWRET